VEMCLDTRELCNARAVLSAYFSKCTLIMTEFCVYVDYRVLSMSLNIPYSIWRSSFRLERHIYSSKCKS
jgi:hypothetical protein